MITKKNIKKNKIIFLVAIILIFSLLVFIKYNNNNKNKGDTQLINNGSTKIAKNNSNEETNKKQASDSVVGNEKSKKSVKPVITYAGLNNDNIEINAYVPELLDDDGVCYADLNYSPYALSKQVQAIKNVSNMSCPAIIINKSELQSMGTWTVSVKYRSSTSEGQSEDRQIEVW